jgi:hypothetical protein
MTTSQLHNFLFSGLICLTWMRKRVRVEGLNSYNHLNYRGNSASSITAKCYLHLGQENTKLPGITSKELSYAVTEVTED